jgi:hypothetical protein
MPNPVLMRLNRLMVGAPDHRRQVMIDGIRTTLQRVKAAAESS